MWNINGRSLHSLLFRLMRKEREIHFPSSHWMQWKLHGRFQTPERFYCTYYWDTAIPSLFLFQRLKRKHHDKFVPICSTLFSLLFQLFIIFSVICFRSQKKLGTIPATTYTSRCLFLSFNLLTTTAIIIWDCDGSSDWIASPPIHTGISTSHPP